MMNCSEIQTRSGESSSSDIKGSLTLLKESMNSCAIEQHFFATFETGKVELEIN
jgi:hypothetical protein